MSDFLKRKFRSGIREFEILTKEEARERGLQPVPWRDGQAGQWVITDDDYVCLCLDRKTFHKQKTPQGLVILAFCRQWVSPKPLNYLAYKATNAWGGSSPAPWVVVEARKTRTKRMVTVFVKMMLAHNIDYTKLGLVYRPDQRIPAATVRRLLRETEIKKMVDAELTKVLSDKGITKESVLDMYLEAARLAKENGKAGELRAIASDLADYLDMKPKPQKNLLPGGDYGDMMKQIEDGMSDAVTVVKEINRPQMVEADFEVVK